MKIAFLLVQDLELSAGGPGRYLPLARELVRLGHQVTLLALHPDYAHCARREFTQDGVVVRYVAQMHVRKSGGHKTYYGPARLAAVSLNAALRLATAARSVDAAVLHLGKAQPINGAAGLLARFLTGRPLYIDCTDYETASNRYYAPGQRGVVSLFEKRLLPRTAAGVTANTRFMARQMAECGVDPARIRYVPNGIARDRFAGVNDDEVAALRDSLGLRGRRVVGYVGSLSLANHAVDLLIKAWPRVARAEPSAALLLVGSGEDADAVKRLVTEAGLDESVRFAGRVEPAKVGAYYRLALTTVDPVLDDETAAARCPLKLIESVAAGVPVVTGDVGDRRELLGDGDAGVLVRPGDAGALADGILSLLQDGARRDTMAEATSRVKERYYWDVLASDFARIYSAVKP